MIKTIKIISIILIFFTGSLIAQQINIPRVEQMPNQPQPYKMRNWKQVAKDYDSYVFDFTLSGEYLPLIKLKENTVNYPDHHSFILHTAVGTYSPGNAEAINLIPAVVGASLVGVDKSLQNNHKWVLYCEEFFNRRPEENVYLNGSIASSGSDWWYDTMPNIFFFQLNDLYPHTGDFDNQVSSVADQWLKSVKRLGGSTTPWKKPYLNYRAFRLATMLPNSDGVKQPEAAGAIGWLLYHAYSITHNEDYRIGAEWCMEFLSSWNQNPSYELQLPYGTYLAARMNAELGTSYNVDKLINWCFSPAGNVREWGVTVGNWGGYDCDGLVGEANSGGYAFVMNGFQQAAALVPMVRYDDRYARAIGKWILNLANASRLFYTNYLPPENQDGETWSNIYDPTSVLAHEALRDKDLDSDNSPFATGDFARSGWGALNFALYGSSHVGYLASIVDTTNVEMILQLDALSTDFYSDSAYATYLYYNPYSRDTSIAIELPVGTYDLYDAVSNQFIITNVTGAQQISIPADAAMLIVLTPAGGTISYEFGRLLVNDVVVDFHSSQPAGNRPPRFKSIAIPKNILFMGDSLQVFATATDPDGDLVTYNWFADQGEISGTGPTIAFLSKSGVGNISVSCIINDPSGLKDTASVKIEVIDNHNPEIKSLKADPAELDLGETSYLYCDAIDPDGDSIQYLWQSNTGSISGSGAAVSWQAPEQIGVQTIYCTVLDENGGQVKDSVEITVGRLVAHYPFGGNANDSSGFNNNGTVNGAQLVVDRFGQANSAYLFDGQTNNISVPVTPSLNFENAISVNFWMRIDELFDREAYPISHGNWENRWKISITNQKIRWTIKTNSIINNGIKDLDSESSLQTGQYYNICTVYDGQKIQIFIDGNLDASADWGGKILQTNLDLLIGQAVPGNTNNNFKGIMDDVRLYNTALSAAEIKELYDTGTRIVKNDHNDLPTEFALNQNYPNPFNPKTIISWQIAVGGEVEITVFNLLGEKVDTLLKDFQPPGKYQIEWNASDLSSGIYIYRLTSGAGFNSTRKLVLLK
jgi:hypothetical protein